MLIVARGRNEMEARELRSAFWRNQDGSWICIDPVTIEHPNGRVQVAPGTTLLPGIPYMGIDLAAWLNDQMQKF
jgi:hypothetical protein